MTPRQKAIRDFVEAQCQGRQNGRSWENLLFACRFQDFDLGNRALRRAISHLVLAGVPIGTDRTHGVYWCVDDLDYRLALENLADEAYPTMRRLEALKKTRERQQPRLI